MTPLPDRNRVVLVTGAASGIGAALCDALVREGGRVVAVDVNQAALRAHPWADRADCRTLDVTDADAFVATIDGLDRLDLCINNAGILAGGGFETFDLATLKRLVDVNLWGVLHGTHAAYRRMVTQGSGHIVNVASMAGLHPVPYSVAYTATKHAVVGLSLALREEGAPRGVRVSVVCPGLVDTDIFAQARDQGGYSYAASVARTPTGKTSPADVAAAILRGVARNDALVVHPSSARVLALAYRVAPTLVARTIARSMRPPRKT